MGGIGSRLGRNKLWVRFLAVSDIYPMFIEPTITWVSSGFSGHIWLDTKIVLKKESYRAKLLVFQRWSKIPERIFPRIQINYPCTRRICLSPPNAHGADSPLCTKINTTRMYSRCTHESVCNGLTVSIRMKENLIDCDVQLTWVVLEHVVFPNSDLPRLRIVSQEVRPHGSEQSHPPTTLFALNQPWT